eukprot:1597398-Pyramimonas_sp.AAC.1
MLCERLRPTITREQSTDQAAYRKGYGTIDHMLTTTLLVEACNEFNTPLWICLVDFEKAFDTVEHESLWEALAEQNVGHEYINLLKRLYAKQSACVTAGTKSRMFDIYRGVKQGDPISSFLFVVVMEAIFRKLKVRWASLNHKRLGSYYGMVIDSADDPLTNLRFADDVLMVASSARDSSRMLVDLETEARKYGLRVHMGKTVLLTNVNNRPATLRCGGHNVRVLQHGQSEKYLGRKLSLDSYHETELQYRIGCGWAAFAKHKFTFCNRRIKLQHRMRLFQASVAPCVIYCSGAWTLTLEQQRQLQSAQRRMIRMILGARRLPDEDWVGFIKRSTSAASYLAQKYGVRDWVDDFQDTKSRLRDKMQSAPGGRWGTRLLDWHPWHHVHAQRHVGRQRKRWQDT